MGASDPPAVSVGHVSVPRHPLCRRQVTQRAPRRGDPRRHERDSIEAHLTIVFAALPVSRSTEAQTGRSNRKLLTTARCSRTIGIQPGAKHHRRRTTTRRPPPNPRRHQLRQLTCTRMAQLGTSSLRTQGPFIGLRPPRRTLQPQGRTSPASNDHPTTGTRRLTRHHASDSPYHRPGWASSCRPCAASPPSLRPSYCEEIGGRGLRSPVAAGLAAPLSSLVPLGPPSAGRWCGILLLRLVGGDRGRIGRAPAGRSGRHHGQRAAPACQALPRVTLLRRLRVTQRLRVRWLRPCGPPPSASCRSRAPEL